MICQWQADLLLASANNQLSCKTYYILLLLSPVNIFFIRSSSDFSFLTLTVFLSNKVFKFVSKIIVSAIAFQQITLVIYKKTQDATV